MQYIATIAEIDDSLGAYCDDCEWRGRVADVAEIEDCILTPGDPSPCGRCPVCDTLVYPEN